MIIRGYRDSDKIGVITLWETCGLTTPQNDPERDIERKLKVDPDLFLVGVLDRLVVATVMGGYDGHRGWINYLAVQPTEQGKGHGQAIMREVEALIHGKGCAKINLQIRSTNEKVISFYSAIGYMSEPVVGMGKRLEHDTQRRTNHD